MEKRQIIEVEATLVPQSVVQSLLTQFPQKNMEEISMEIRNYVRNGCTEEQLLAKLETIVFFTKLQGFKKEQDISMSPMD